MRRFRVSVPADEFRRQLSGAAAVPVPERPPKVRAARPRAEDTRQVAPRSGLLRQVKGGQCWLCGRNVNRKERRHGHPGAPSVDHVIPLSRGGTHRQSNLRLAHVFCNQTKGNQEPIVDDDVRRTMATAFEAAVERFQALHSTAKGSSPRTSP